GTERQWRREGGSEIERERNMQRQRRRFPGAGDDVGFEQRRAARCGRWRVAETNVGVAAKVDPQTALSHS
ncbi:unnamed protein product, partial [Lampetra planeri]